MDFSINANDKALKQATFRCLLLRKVCLRPDRAGFVSRNPRASASLAHDGQHRLQLFRASKKPQSSAHLCPILGATDKGLSVIVIASLGLFSHLRDDRALVRSHDFGQQSLQINIGRPHALVSTDNWNFQPVPYSCRDATTPRPARQQLLCADSGANGSS